MTLSDNTYVVRDPVTEEGSTRIVVDVTHAKELEAQLRSQAHARPANGCYNRRYLLALGERTQQGATRCCGAAFRRHRRFKQFNDVRSPAWRRNLQPMARFLMRQVRADEPVIRWRKTKTSRHGRQR